jgi:RNase P/RNase MRP subunit p30
MKFTDLHLCVPSDNLEQAKRLILKSAELGYSQVGVPLTPSIREETVDRLRQISAEAGLDFVTRLDLAPRSSGELLMGLRRFRRHFEVVSVLCNSKSVARQAAKDRRVDLLCFRSFDSGKRFFDRAEAELASASSAAFEIDLAHVLNSVESRSGVGVFSRIRREVAIASSHGVPLVISSGASEPLLLRRPRDYAAFALLFGLDESQAKSALSISPSAIVERSRRKQGEDFVVPGVRLVEGRRDV